MHENCKLVMDAYEQTGSKKGASKLLNWTRKKTRYWFDKAQEGGLETPDDETTIEYEGSIKTLEQLLNEMEVDTTKWSVDNFRANAWEALGADGEKRTLFQVRANLSHKPEFTPAELHASLRRTQCESEEDCPELLAQDVCLVIPDTQHGFRKDKITGEMTPFHDTSAWKAMLDSAARCRPSEVVLLGDHLDLNEWSTKYTRGVDHWFTTQAAIQALHDDLAELREVVGWNCRIRYIEGNHEHRLQVMLQDRVPQLCAVSGANSIDPVVSVSNLLRLKELGIEYVGPYGEELWLWDEVRIHHGNVVRSEPGATVQSVLKTADYSEVFGHIHRVEGPVYKTIHGPGGTREIFVLTPGTLSRIDGAVPPGRRANWQQGFAYITRDEDGNIWPRAVRIRDGRYLQWP